MPVQYASRRGKDRRKIDLASSAIMTKAPRRDKAPYCFEIDEDKLYEPDWETASEADLDAYVDISLRED